jgi:hypothetical protein
VFVKRNILIVMAAISICFVILAFTALNIGHTVTNSDGYVSTVKINDVEPDNWSRLGVQLHYAPGNEEIAKEFIEKIARLLQSKGISEVLILPSFVDMQALEKDIEGVLIFHFDAESSGWHFSRQGSISAAAEFIPLVKGSLVTMNIGETTSAVGRGWFNRSHFDSELIDAAADYWVQEALKGFNLVDHQGEEESNLIFLDSNVDDIPPVLSGLITSDGNLQNFIKQGDNYVLSYLTADRNLESILESEFTDRHNMKVVLPWVDATGGRRLIELISKDSTQEVRIYYSDTAKLPHTGGFDSPKSSDSIEKEFLVTIISLTCEQT